MSYSRRNQNKGLIVPAPPPRIYLITSLNVVFRIGCLQSRTDCRVAVSFSTDAAPSHLDVLQRHIRSTNREFKSKEHAWPNWPLSTRTHL